MTKRAASVLAAVAFCAACTEKPAKPAPPPPRYVGGIAVDEPDHLLWLTRLKSAGFDTVEVTVYATQADWDGAELVFDEALASVAAEMRLAKTLGLKVVIVLRVALDHGVKRNRFFWHGMIHPDEAHFDAWFERYGVFVEQWARVAEREHADVFAIASEMSALTNTRPVDARPDLERYYLDDAVQTREREVVVASNQLTPARLAATGAGDYVDAERFLRDRSAAWRAWAEVTAHTSAPDPIAAINARRARLEAKWRALIQRVRAIYGGAVTYAANFDQYRGVGFWDALDLIGINAYFPLRSGLGPTDRATLAAGWRSSLERIADFRRARGLESRRVLFTELGYRRRQGATAAPWASGVFDVLYFDGAPELVVWPERPRSTEERAMAIHALADVVEDAAFSKMFAGALYWKLSTRAEHAAIEPFVLTLDDAAGDPTLPALIRFTSAAKPARVESP